MGKLFENWKTTGLGISLILVAVFKTVSTGVFDTADVMAGLAAIGFIAASDAK